MHDIAGHLANKCFYSLQFSPAEEVTFLKPTRKSVDISFSIDTELYQAEPNDLKLKRDYLPDTEKAKFSIEGSPYYNSNRLVFSVKTQEDIKKEALAKLTPEEKDALGLKE